TVIAMTVEPMAAPKPALKYLLLPELKEMTPGNPIQAYLKCFCEQQSFFFDKTSIDNREKWLKMPLKELPLAQLHDYGGGALKQADHAARLYTPDWQILLKLKSDGFNVLLNDVQQMRTLSGPLIVRVRVAVAEHRFDDAIISAKTTFALARHVGDHPT